MRSLVILGSTGSIGKQTLDIVRSFPSEFKILGLAAGTNLALLLRQAEEFRPELLALQTPPTGFCLAGQAAALLQQKGKIVTMEEMAASTDADLVVVATSGSAGLGSLLAAIEASKNVVLANKEALVMAGKIVTEKARKKGIQILPVDSEHSAVWQCLRGEGAGGSPSREVARIILTASGGPFRGLTREEMARVTPEQALRHPTWRMGKKITIDSATLFNKGLEVIEAHWLFGIPYSNIDVVIHPECIIHSLVEFRDGSIKAQLGYPDMRLPIQLALSYPERWPNPELPRLDIREIKGLTFEPPDPERSPCLRLAREAGERGGTLPAVVSAADEVAVELFLSHKLGFADIPRVLEGTLQAHKGVSDPDIDEVLAADSWARKTALRLSGELV